MRWLIPPRFSCLGLVLAAGLFAVIPQGVADASLWESEAGDWKGYAACSFAFEGRDCSLVVPKTAAEGRPWIWRAGPREVAPELDVALLAKGFHVVHMDVADLYGSPKAVALWQKLYEALTGQDGFSKRPAIEAYGPGGLEAFNWAAAHPKSVACVYADAPVLDIESWPGGKGKGEGSPEDWQALLGAYSFASEDAALAYEQNPVDQVKNLADAEVPLFLVCGDKDDVVPPEENTRRLWKDYVRTSHGEFNLVERREKGHEYGLADPVATAYFVLRHTVGLPEAVPEEALPGMLNWKPATFGGQGAVRVLDEVMFLGKGDDMTGVNWTGPVLTMDYEINLEAMRAAGDDFFCGLTVPYADSWCTFVVGGWGGTCVGISSIDFNDAYNNETARFMSFDRCRWYALRLRITADKIQAWIDDEPMVDVVTTGRDIGIRWECEKSTPLGIATWRTTGAIRNFSLRPL